ncbi:unnamed protein product, partial [Allacma fusca]
MNPSKKSQILIISCGTYIHSFQFLVGFCRTKNIGFRKITTESNSGKSTIHWIYSYILEDGSPSLIRQRPNFQLL